MRILLLCAVFLFTAILLTPPEVTVSAGKSLMLACQYDGKEGEIWECLGIKLGKITLEVLYSYFSIGHIKL
ncbi:hypothetical protein UNDYM_3710 [Undibacterium sp. YM2]|uniref:hypothetical protein n=1 Tax=Undibacterium sp. YM2 TaxID=2058625 RepID=UPI001331D93C|nr:hypothetical protein [Undibacterium sp. YM2]BBB67963.1 hypothetical protein UNDYM_3710 [Undibacterium sp. YM2]